jgi:PAS domain S-box-containing protein
MNLSGSLQTLNALSAAEPGRVSRGDLVYDRHVMWLRYLGVARIGVLSFLAVGAALMDLESGQRVLLAFYVAGLAACIGYLYTLQRTSRVGFAQACVQLLVDFAVVAVTVGYTQGATSFFTFMFVVVVLEAGLLLGLSQGFVLATMAAAFMALQLFLPAIWTHSAVRFELVYNLLVQSLAFYLAAFISGHWNRRIHRLQEFQREILDNMNSGFLITDARGTLSVLNQAAREILGLRGEVNPGRHVSGVFRVASGGECPVVTALRSGQDFVSYEFEAVNATGQSVLLGLTTNTLRDDSGHVTGVIASFTDLTEMHAMREELRRHDRLAVVGELAAGLAHEIRNPVAVIRGALEEMGRGPMPSALEDKLRGMAIRESDHLNEIVAGFLDFAREPSRKREIIDVRELIQEIADLLRHEHAAAPGLTIRVSCPSAARQLSCDSSQMKQVFVNLGKNAIEAMNGRGALEISVNEGPGLIEVRFDDEGPGIEPDKVARIFEPFFTTKDTGVGMGLAVCMRIVTAHDGTLRASARQGGGCSMRVSLPAAGQS